MYWYCKYYDENSELHFANGSTKESLDNFNKIVKEKNWMIKLPTFKIIW